MRVPQSHPQLPSGAPLPKSDPLTVVGDTTVQPPTVALWSASKLLFFYHFYIKDNSLHFTLQLMYVYIYINILIAQQNYLLSFIKKKNIFHDCELLFFNFFF